MTKISIDTKIFNDTCCSKAVYALAEKYIIERKTTSDTSEDWIIMEKEPSEGLQVKKDVFECLNDFKLRTIIEKETHDIKTILYAKAFMECDNVEESDMNE